MKRIALTHCGKLGDMLYCLPIASWLARQKDCKIEMVLPRCFPPFRHVEALLMEQPFIAKVTFVDHQCNWHGHAGQPYKFNPAQYGVTGEYYNLGFRAYPDKFVTAFVAEEHGFGWDKDFTLSLGKWVTFYEPDVLRSEQPEVGVAVPHAKIYPIPIDILELGRMLHDAKEAHLWYSGPAALMFLARLPFYLHYVAGHPPRSIYLPPDQFGGSLIKPVFSNAPSRP
jgi:hypothetical protein